MIWTYIIVSYNLCFYAFCQGTGWNTTICVLQPPSPITNKSTMCHCMTAENKFETEISISSTNPCGVLRAQHAYRASYAGSGCLCNVYRLNAPIQCVRGSACPCGLVQAQHAHAMFMVLTYPSEELNQSNPTDLASNY